MISKVKPLLYDQIQNMLYGLLHREILFYRKIVKDLESYGFQINPYGTCVAKM